MKWKNFVNFVEPELGSVLKWACVGRVYIAEVLHGVQKKFTFSFSKNRAELPTSLDVFLSLFLSLRVFSLCLGKVSPRRWTKFPQRDRNSPESHTSEEEKKKKGFFHIREIKTDGLLFR